MNKGILRIIEGDVTNPQITTPNEIVVIPHMCNNLRVMEAGVALALRNKWGKVYNTYMEMAQRNNKLYLGEISKTTVEFILNTTKVKIIVVNMIAQSGTVSQNNLIPIRYKALINCMVKVFDYIETIKSKTSNPIVIHCPKFGSDLAGGNWNFILELIREIWLENGIDVVVYEFKADSAKWEIIE